MESNLNSLSITVTDASGAVIPDIDGSIANALGIQFETFYPGGLYGSGSFVMPRLPELPTFIKPPYRVKIYNGNNICWEGIISATSPSRDARGTGQRIELLGWYGYLLMRRTINKPWADDRISEDAWKFFTGSAGFNKCTIDRRERLRFTPKAVAWSTDQAALLYYSAPYGQTVKRITFDYDLQEAAQSWQLEILSSTDASSWSSIHTVATSSGTGSTDHSLGTPRRFVALAYRSKANQTPTSDGTYYGEFTNIVARTETDDPITMNVVIGDIVAANNGIDSTISTDTGYLTTPASELTLEPYFTRRFETYADIIARAVEYGDAANNAYAFYLGASSKASDGLPVPVLEAWPDVDAGFDYQVSLHDKNVARPFSIRNDDIGQIDNFIPVEYSSENGFPADVNPFETAGLQDADSIAAYGRLAKVLKAGSADSTTAIAAGQRYLARHKDPIPEITSPIIVSRYINGGDGNIIPACQIRAGKRIKISDYQTSYVAVITRTQYSHNRQECAITVGRKPDDASLLLAQLSR